MREHEDYCDECGFAYDIAQQRECCECEKPICPACAERNEGMCEDCHEEWLDAAG